LIDEARRVLGFKSKTDTVVLSLQELVRRKRIEELKSLMGSWCLTSTSGLSAAAAAARRRQ